MMTYRRADLCRQNRAQAYHNVEKLHKNSISYEEIFARHRMRTLWASDEDGSRYSQV